jgi:enoyl-CoA hydratase
LDIMTTLLYVKNEGVATITFNRPEARNALTPEMLCRLADAIADFAADDSIRVAIITGTGEKAFCAGGDLATTLPLLTGARAPADEWDRRLLDDPVVAAASALREYPLHKPVIAAINGACLAAGMELMLATDIRVVAEHATFGLPEVTRALIPFAGSMARLPRQVAYCHAMELLLVGDAIGAWEAHRIGLVNHVLPAGQVLARAEGLARKIAANGPLAVQRVKQTVLATSGLPLAQAYGMEDEAKRVVLSSADAKEGPSAFVQKRIPHYFGS